MKKLALALALLTTATVASAHGWEHGGYRGGYHGGYYRGYDPIVPMVIGGIAGYAIAEAHRQPPVVYQTPYCTPWTETMDQYGVVTRTRTCTQ